VKPCYRRYVLDAPIDSSVSARGWFAMLFCLWQVLTFRRGNMDVEVKLCYFVVYEVFDEVGVIWD